MKKWFGQGSLESLKVEWVPYAWHDGKYCEDGLLLWPTEDELLIGYDYSESYEGSCYMLFRRNSILYEVENSHCSCNNYSEDANIFQDQGMLDKHVVTGQYLRNKDWWRFSDIPEAMVLMDHILETEP